ncbi:DUF1707 domain-containing protein [Streptomyces sp. NPDC006739]|uniref:DUF1707 SHOCT-like domain-containing protein n=1 Tax=Streptomyces sp. NPDC006739 TaxID=3364763 RepID=UPI0036B9CDA8
MSRYAEACWERFRSSGGVPAPARRPSCGPLMRTGTGWWMCGLLTADELDERLEAALSAWTVSELTALTVDLPAAGAAGAEVKDVVRIESTAARSSAWGVGWAAEVGARGDVLRGDARLHRRCGHA